MNKNKSMSRPKGKGADIGALLAQREYSEASRFCEQALAESPNSPKLLHYFAIAQEKLGHHDQARRALVQALATSPRNAQIHNDLGIVLESLKKLPEAEASYCRALALNPALAEAHGNLSSLLNALERPHEAIRHAKEAIRLNPNNSASWVALGDAYRMTSDLKAAESAFEHALKSTTPSRRAYTSLFQLYLSTHRTEEGIALLERARKQLNDNPLILNDLAQAYGALERYQEAQPLFELAYSQLLETTTLYNIIHNLSNMKRWEEVFSYEAEVLKHPQPNTAISPLFAAAAELCNWDLMERLLPSFLEWCRLEESELGAATKNLLRLLPVPSVDPQAIRMLLERMAGKGRRIYAHSKPAFDYAPAKNSRRKLRIGYMSGDFRMHVVNLHISGQLSNYDKEFFEVYCYSNLDAAKEDGITEQYRHAVDTFVDVSKITDLQLARRIHDDGIHVLVDLSGYTSGSRLGTMFYQSAPVQVTYLGYPFTSGVKEIDYFLTDSWLNGPRNPSYFVENVLEISRSYVTSGKLEILPRQVHPPILRNGYVTFGTLNNCYKLNKATIAVWSRILTSTPGAKMVLNHPSYATPLTRTNILSEFARNGTASDRISFVWDRHPEGSHLYWYESIDVALDTFPLTGGTTTFEALWMGVPVVTLVGQINYQRLSYSLLKNCGIDTDDLIASDEEEFVAKAVALGQEPERIAAFHADLCREVPRSILCDPTWQIRYFEEALVDSWNRKFPEQPRFTPETFTYTRLDSPAAPLVATAASADNLYRYVIQEQGRWFAPEYEMLQKLGHHIDGLAVEIGAEPGFFSLELAQGGRNALCLSSSTIAARMIQAAAGRGGLAEQVEVRLESPQSPLLDRAELRNVALLRIGTEANDGASGPIVRNPNFWQTNAPIVLLSVHAGDKSDPSTAERLVTMGYGLYRLLPGLGCFVPYQLGEALDPYTLYLLACPHAREPVLVAARLLVMDTKPVPAQEIEGLSNATLAPEPWQRMDEWVIRCANLAHEAGQDPGERIALLQLALETQQALIQGAPSTTRRITLARLLSDMGRRVEAVSHMNQAIAEIEQGSAQVTMPFLAPSATWDDISPEDHFAEWLFAALVETRCRMAAHSTYFLAEAEFGPLESLSSIGFETTFSRNAVRARQERDALR